MCRVHPRLACVTAVILLIAALSPAGFAQEWNNLGGNSARNGLSAAVYGPTSEDSLWNNNDDFSIIAWAPFISGGRAFTIREAGFPQSGGAANDALVAYDEGTGGELWRVTLPFGGNTSTEWIAWILGARDGRVYASRSSHNQPAVIRAYDAATGAPLWISDVGTQAFAYDGVVFAPDGDLIVGDFVTLYRIDADTGDTVWSTPRSSSVSGNSGATATATAAFIEQPVVGGQVVSKFDLASGAFLYSSSLMPGFTEQNSTFTSADGSVVYFSRTQNNASVDYLFAFQDTGSALVEMWRRPIKWTTSHEHGIGPDGSIYAFLQTDEFVRLDPLTGSVLDSAGVLPFLANASPKTAVDAAGNVYVSNGWASTPATNGRLWAFNADLSVNYFTVTLNRQNQGGPALGAGGTLVVCDRTGVHAYRGSPPPCDPCDTNCDGSVNPFDIQPFIDLLSGGGPGPCSACAGDANGDGTVNPFDINGFIECLMP